MGVPQTRHRVFFIAFRNDIQFDFDNLDMYFNYEPITYGEIQNGIGEELNHDTVIYKWLLKSKNCDKRISDTVIRYGEKEKLFTNRICWPENIMQTVTGNGEILRGIEKTRVSCEDIISAQTFPQDYDFIDRTYKNVRYICGMSVPPVALKHIVERIIDTGVFEI